MYNVRVKRFLDVEQVQIFSEPMLSSGSEREDKRKVIYSTGEIVPTNRRKIFNEFDEEFVSGMNIGNEEENMKRSVRRTKNMIYDIARSNKWEWFFTLTFNPEKVNSYDYTETTRKLSVWFNNMKKKCIDMKYIVVPEQHESGRWHFHGLFANVENMVFVDSMKKDRKGRVIYNVGSYKLGFSTATQISDLHKACSYIAKYTTQELCAVTKGKKRYWHSRNIDMPIIEEYFCSLGNEELKRVKGMSEHIKTVCSEYVDVTYLELPIYTTNTNFSKRYRQNYRNRL